MDTRAGLQACKYATSVACQGDEACAASLGSHECSPTIRRLAPLQVREPARRCMGSRGVRSIVWLWVLWVVQPAPSAQSQSLDLAAARPPIHPRPWPRAGDCGVKSCDRALRKCTPRRPKAYACGV